MAKPYANELERLEETFHWARSVDIDPLKRAVKTAGLSPLASVGSGGSLTAAHALAWLHQSFAGKPAVVNTPLEAVDTTLDVNVAQWLLTAGGSNVDINAAAKYLIEREYRQVAVMCGRQGSPVTELCDRHPFVDLLMFSPPAGKDGFLATNSLLAFTSLLARAYQGIFDPRADWTDVHDRIAPMLNADTEIVQQWRADTSGLWARPTTIVLYGPSTKVGAIDIESKFTEAALGVAQIADYRNFAHGRHHWLAKRGEESSVLALVGDEDEAIADRTLALIPPGVPTARLKIPGRGITSQIGSLLAALHVTGWIGSARGIDPGQPGVPEFGRKLYHLSLPVRPRLRPAKNMSTRAISAIERKTGESVLRLERRGTLTQWQEAYSRFADRLEATAFGGVILDYDGTVVDTRDRFQPAKPDMAAELIRVAESNAVLAFATGRGVSVRKDLRKVLPERLWSRVVVGYYNGSMIASLDDDAWPDGTDEVCPELKDLAAALAESEELAGSADQTNRRYQITLEPRHYMAENRLWDLTHQIILRTGCRDAIVTRSSHSVDIVATGVTKTNVVRHVLDMTSGRAVLAIGDRGRWPGNDYELLNNFPGLSVDEVSVDPDTCWNFAEAGQRGIAVTRMYLEALVSEEEGLRFRGGLSDE